jgi:hypothetical protein
MRRDSPQAKAIIARHASEVGFTPYQLEKWSQEDLLPLDGTPPAQERRHYAALVEMNKGRMSADRKAFALAANLQLGCDRLRDAIARAHIPGCESAADYASRIGPAPPEPIDRDSDEGNEIIEGYQFAVQTAELEGQGPEGLPELLGELSSWFQPENGAAPVFDSCAYSGSGVKPRQVPPEQIRDSFDINVFAAAFGGGIYDGEAFVALAGKSGLSKAQGEILDTLSDGWNMFDDANRLLISAPVQALADGAFFARKMMAEVPKMTDNQKDAMAAMSAPAFLALLLRLVRFAPAAAIQMARVLGFQLTFGELVTPPST